MESTSVPAALVMLNEIMKELQEVKKQIAEIKKPSEPDADQEVVFNTEQACEFLGIGRNKLYELCQSPDFPSIKVGNKILIPKWKLKLWMDSVSKLSYGGGTVGS